MSPEIADLYVITTRVYVTRLLWLWLMSLISSEAFCINCSHNARNITRALMNAQGYRRNSRTLNYRDTHTRKWAMQKLKFITFLETRWLRMDLSRCSNKSFESRARKPTVSDYQLKCGLAWRSKRDNYATVSREINRNVIRICGS